MKKCYNCNAYGSENKIAFCYCPEVVKYNKGVERIVIKSSGSEAVVCEHYEEGATVVRMLNKEKGGETKK